jgi:hypothetical protein
VLVDASTELGGLFQRRSDDEDRAPWEKQRPVQRFRRCRRALALLARDVDDDAAGYGDEKLGLPRVWRELQRFDAPPHRIQRVGETLEGEATLIFD